MNSTHSLFSVMDAHLKRIEPRFLLYAVTSCSAEFLLISILAVKPTAVFKVKEKTKACVQGRKAILSNKKEKEKRKLPGESLNIVVSRKRNQMVLVMCS